MTKRLLFIVVFLFALLLAAAPVVAAAPPDWDQPPGWENLPPDVGVKVFIHYAKGHGPANPAKPPKPAPNAGCSGDAFGTALCNTYDYSRIHWSTPAAVRYAVNSDGSKVSGKTFTDALGAAFQTWDTLANGIAYVYAGDASGTPGVYDSENVIGWQRLQDGTIAVTYVWYSRASRNILQFDMAFNTGYAWSYTAPSVPETCAPETGYCDPTNSGKVGTFDILNIATHEAGHTLMLDDLYEAGASDLTMFGYADFAQINKDTLGKGDISGVKAIYP